MNSSYRRVTQDEGGTGTNTSSSSNNNGDESSDVTRSRSERMQDKLIAFAWIILALTVNRYTSFFGRIWWNVDPDEKIHGSMMKLVYIGIAMELCMILYLTVYLPKMKGLKDVAAWNIYCPKIIPTMIILGLITYLLFLRATWGIWGFLTPLISGTQFMGFLMILHFIPSFGLV